MPVQRINRLLMIFFLCFVACRPDENARSHLEQAQNLYENAQYGSAKQTLDELRTHSPKAYEIQKEALQLMRKIELKEQERNLWFCDSLLTVLQAEADTTQSLPDVAVIRKNIERWKQEKTKAQKRILYLHSKL